MGAAVRRIALLTLVAVAAFVAALPTYANPTPQPHCCGPTPPNNVVVNTAATVGPPINLNMLGANTTNTYDLTRPGIGADFTAAGLHMIRYPDGGNSDFTDVISGLNGPNGTPCSGNAKTSSNLANFYSDIAAPSLLNVALEINYGSDQNCDPGVGSNIARAVSSVISASEGLGNVTSATIGNEQYLTNSGHIDCRTGPSCVPSGSPQPYSANEPAYYTAVKNVDSRVNVCVDTNLQSPNNHNWNHYVFNHAMYDCAEMHYYPQGANQPTSDNFLLFSAIPQYTSEVNFVKCQLATDKRLPPGPFVGCTPPPSTDTPVSLYTGEVSNQLGPYGQQAQSIVSALYAGMILGESAQDGVTQLTWHMAHGYCLYQGGDFSGGSYGWQTTWSGPNMFGNQPANNCATTAKENTLLPVANAFLTSSYFFHSGEHMLQTSVGGPGFVQAYAATNGTGFAIMLFNLSQTVPQFVAISLNGYSGGNAGTVVTYDKDIYDETNPNPPPPLVPPPQPTWAPPTISSIGNWGGTISITLPVWSMTVIQTSAIKITPTPSPTPKPTAPPFKHLVYIIMENRSTDELFSSDTTLVGRGMNLSQTATLAAWAPIITGTEPCIGTKLTQSCYELFKYPTTHIPMTYGTIGNGVKDSYDMSHTHGAFTQEDPDNGPITGNRHAFYNCTPTCTSVLQQSPAGVLPNTGWGDSCQGTSGVTPCNNSDLGNCNDQSAPGGCAANCPVPAAIAPTPTPMPVPTPSPFPSGWGCGLGYLNAADIQPYQTMAETYGVSDNSFQTNESPSAPSHWYASSGASWSAALVGGVRTDTHSIINNLSGLASGEAGCDAPATTQIRTLDIYNGGQTFVFPCPPVISLFDQLSAGGISFRYYASQENAPYFATYRDALDMYPNWGCVNNDPSPPNCPSQFTNNFGLINEPPGGSPDATNNQFLADVQACNLKQMTWLTPTSLESDHGGVTDGSGPAWVATMVNAIGTNKSCDTNGYWKDTLIVITWDDWGGWYDHVEPPIYNKGEDGFRVPLIVISAYSKLAYISHVQYEIFGSVLKHAEERWSLPTMNNTDFCSRDTTGTCQFTTNDLSDFLDYTQTPHTFTPIVANLPDMPKEGIIAVKDPKTGAWQDLDWRAVMAYFIRKQAKDHACVDECGKYDNK